MIEKPHSKPELKITEQKKNTTAQIETRFKTHQKKYHK